MTKVTNTAPREEAALLMLPKRYNTRPVGKPNPLTDPGPLPQPTPVMNITSGSLRTITVCPSDMSKPKILAWHWGYYRLNRLR